MTEEFKTQIRKLIRESNMQYLWNQEGKEHTLTQCTKADTHGSVLCGEFLRALVGSAVLDVGVQGLLFTQEKIHYDKYIWVGDEQRPAPDAKCFSTGRYVTFCTAISLSTGHVVLADTFESLTWEPRVFA